MSRCKYTLWLIKESLSRQRRRHTHMHFRQPGILLLSGLSQGISDEFSESNWKKKYIQIMHNCRGNNWDLYVGRFQTVIKRWRVKLVTILFRGNNVHDSVWALECSDWQCDSCSLWLWPHPLALSSCLPLLQIDLCLMKIRIAVKEEQGLGTFFFFFNWS